MGEICWELVALEKNRCLFKACRV